MSRGDDSWQGNDDSIMAKEITCIDILVALELQFINEVEAVESSSQLPTQNRKLASSSTPNRVNVSYIPSF